MALHKLGVKSAALCTLSCCHNQ